MKGVRWFRRVLAGDAAAHEAAGWQRAARDWSDSVGPLVLMEWAGASAPPEVQNMTQLPSMGDRVRVWPAPGVRVQDGAAAFGRFLPAEGREVEWDVYFHRRFLEGSVLLHDPAPADLPEKG